MKTKNEVIEVFNQFTSKYNFIQKKKFHKGETILTFIENRNMIVFFEEGEADLIRYDGNGNRTIVEHYSPGHLFSEMFYFISLTNELFVEAKKDCSVILFRYDDAVNRNSSALNSLLLDIFTNKLLGNNNRIEVLTRRSIREKLLSYFDMMTSRNLRKSFRLPFSYSDLADYLSIDRSAMMREIKNLIDDGIIEKDGRKITKLY